MAKTPDRLCRFTSWKFKSHARKSISISADLEMASLRFPPFFPHGLIMVELFSETAFLRSLVSLKFCMPSVARMPRTFSTLTPMSYQPVERLMLVAEGCLAQDSRICKPEQKSEAKQEADKLSVLTPCSGIGCHAS